MHHGATMRSLEGQTTSVISIRSTPNAEACSQEGRMVGRMGTGVQTPRTPRALIASCSDSRLWTAHPSRIQADLAYLASAPQSIRERYSD